MENRYMMKGIYNCLWKYILRKRLDIAYNVNAPPIVEFR